MIDTKEPISHIQGDSAFRHIISECGADGKVWYDKRFICDYVSRLKHLIEQLEKANEDMYRACTAAEGRAARAELEVGNLKEKIWDLEHPEDEYAETI